MDTTSAPQLIEHLSKSLDFTPYETKWIPDTSKFVLCGSLPRATGTIQIHQLSRHKLEVIREINHPTGVKCGTFGACLPNKADYAFGDFKGDLNIVDIETGRIYFTAHAHHAIVNSIDGIGGLDSGYGAPELVTGGRDGCVKLWDPRQKDPVLSLEPIEKEPVVPDCWCVGFGNSYNNDERMIVSGYDNGDLKFFDLRKNELIWETNLKNGVVGLEFDRRDIIMNKLVTTTLEGKFQVFDLRTQHPENGFATLQEPAFKSTIWGVHHLPQNRDIFACQGGDGALNLYKYAYPSERALKDSEGRMKGCVGSVELLNNHKFCEQPINSFDWNKNKVGLGVMCALDQTCKVIIGTKLNQY